MDVVTVFHMFTDLWHMYKKVEEMTNKFSDKFWEDAIGEFGAFSEKYNNHPFACSLCLAVSDEFERRYKDATKDN